MDANSISVGTFYGKSQAAHDVMCMSLNWSVGRNGKEAKKGGIGVVKKKKKDDQMKLRDFSLQVPKFY